jgi:hypothetical protein
LRIGARPSTEVEGRTSGRFARRRADGVIRHASWPGRVSVDSRGAEQLLLETLDDAGVLILAIECLGTSSRRAKLAPSTPVEHRTELGQGRLRRPLIVTGLVTPASPVRFPHGCRARTSHRPDYRTEFHAPPL